MLYYPILLLKANITQGHKTRMTHQLLNILRLLCPCLQGKKIKSLNFIILVVKGDQIGRIYAQWAIVYFGQCFENYWSGANFWATLFHGTSYVLIMTKNGWATFWATFSQTRLVTLSPFQRFLGWAPNRPKANNTTVWKTARRICSFTWFF
jgi:hypothetical protein